MTDIGQIANLNYYPLTKANYMRDENATRIELNNSDETMYYASYASISTCNLIIEHVPTATESTDAERDEVIAYARVLRAINYFYLVNFYAETYQENNASTCRYNIDAKHARILSKVVDGQTISLSPTSHMWTMPFPMGAIKNQGNATIVQNLSK
ncbi:MAG: RagB/SusD family nutrient uptake outer membrane protein [Prevotellaceae bacterium]|jgi:hypothetical protein|nr:RagB/SusD family nutrient uptake outer membrane protein [Prevotellaceae bacterium]